jgi:hypothetical protein
MSSYTLTFPRDIDALFEGTSAAGPAGQAVQRALRDIYLETKARASNWSQSVESEVAEIATDCSLENWDGYGAPPVKPAALEGVRRLADALLALVPAGIPAPDVVPDVDGDVSLSWTRDRRRGLSISVNARGEMSFAAILDKGVERHGVETFDGMDRSALQEIARYVARLYGR